MFDKIRKASICAFGIIAGMMMFGQGCYAIPINVMTSLSQQGIIQVDCEPGDTISQVIKKVLEQSGQDGNSGEYVAIFDGKLLHHSFSLKFLEIVRDGIASDGLQIFKKKETINLQREIVNGFQRKREMILKTDVKNVFDLVNLERDLRKTETIFNSRVLEFGYEVLTMKELKRKIRGLDKAREMSRIRKQFLKNLESNSNISDDPNIYLEGKCVNFVDNTPRLLQPSESNRYLALYAKVKRNFNWTSESCTAQDAFSVNREKPLCAFHSEACCGQAASATPLPLAAGSSSPSMMNMLNNPQ